MSYVGYNIMYYKKKKTGKPYRVINPQPTKAKARGVLSKINRDWNKLEKKSGYSVKIHSIKRVKKRR